MMHLDFDRTGAIAQERYEDLRRQAASFRLCRQNGPAAFDAVLARLGRLLVAAGNRLEHRALPQPHGVQEPRQLISTL